MRRTSACTSSSATPGRTWPVSPSTFCSSWSSTASPRTSSVKSGHYTPPPPQLTIQHWGNNDSKSCPKSFGKNRAAKSPLVTVGCPKFTPKTSPFLLVLCCCCRGGTARLRFLLAFSSHPMVFKHIKTEGHASTLTNPLNNSWAPGILGASLAPSLWTFHHRQYNRL